MSRIISLVYTLIIVGILLWVFISYIVPHVADSLVSLTNNIPSYISALQNEIMTKLNNFHLLDESVIDVESIIQKSLTQIQNLINMFISNLLNFTIGITNFFVNLFLGIVIAMYILLSKEKLILQFKKFICFVK